MVNFTEQITIDEPWISFGLMGSHVFFTWDSWNGYLIEPPKFGKKYEYDSGTSRPGTPQTSLDGFAKTGGEVEEGGGDVGPAHASLLWGSPKDYLKLQAEQWGGVAPLHLCDRLLGFEHSDVMLFYSATYNFATFLRHVDFFQLKKPEIVSPLKQVGVQKSQSLLDISQPNFTTKVAMEVIKAFCGDVGPLQVPEIGDFTMKTMGNFWKLGFHHAAHGYFSEEKQFGTINRCSLDCFKHQN